MGTDKEIDEMEQSVDKSREAEERLRAIRAKRAAKSFKNWKADLNYRMA